MIRKPIKIITRYLIIFLLLAVCLQFSLLSTAQEKPNRFTSLIYLEGRVNYGFVIPHHKEIWALTDGYFPVWEFSIFRQTDGRHDYHYFRRYPQLGLTWLYTDFGFSEPLGVMHAFMPNIRIPMIRSEKLSLAFGMGLGAAYVSKKFDRLENYKNLTIGSHLNAAVQFQLRLRIQINYRVHFNMGASMLHVSNGTVKTPNYGLNIPGLFAGLDWKLTGRKITYIRPEHLPKKKGKVNFRLMGAVASKQTEENREDDFRVYVGSAIFSGFYNNTDRFLFGLDAVYDESNRYELKQKGKPVDEYLDVAKIGVSLGHEWTFSRLSAFICLGYYIHNNYEDDAVLYNKIGVNYNFLKFAFIGVNLQAHWAKAEFLSFGIGLNI